MLHLLARLVFGVIALVVAGFACGVAEGHMDASPVSGGDEANDAAIDNQIRLAAAEIAGKDLPPQWTYDQLGRIPYVSGQAIQRQGCHSGQRKLLLTEIEFLTCCANDADFVIYAGSAPCEKLPVLLGLFPKLKFLLVDPNFHSFVSEPPPVYIYQAATRISKDTLRKIRDDLRLAGRPGYENKKRSANAAMNVGPIVYKQKVKPDMSASSPEHVAEMKRIEDEWKATNHVSMVGDLISGPSRVFIIQDYMTPALAQMIKVSMDSAKPAIGRQPKVVFISDLRTNFFGPSPIDIDFMWNDAIQLLFLRALRPEWTMLKFHPPYMDFKTSDPIATEIKSGSTKHPMYATIRADFAAVKEAVGLDFLADYAKHDGRYRYFKTTTVWLQAWAPPSSSEARLIISAADIEAPWQVYDAREWDERFVYNKRLRSYAYYGAFYETIRARPGQPYDGCFDCCLEIVILLNYIMSRSAPASVAIDSAKLVAGLKDKKTQDELFALRARLDDVLIYSPYAKCQFHGQVREPNEEPIFYVRQVKPSATGKLTDIETYQMSVGPGQSVEKKLILTHHCGAKPPTWKYADGVTLSVGKKYKVKADPDRHEAYARRGLKVCGSLVSASGYVGED